MSTGTNSTRAKRIAAPETFRLVCLGLATCGLLSALPAQAQLAITEVMAWASIDCPGCENTGNPGCRPDFWELTNFGNEEIGLTNYLFVDREIPFPGSGTPWKLPQIAIQPGESIIFVREGWTEIPDAAAFRAWWGESKLPSGLQIYFYPENGYGFDYLGDGVRLYDPASNIVDYVFFAETKRRGSSFGYNTNNGDALESVEGVCGAFRAAACDDIGSPGSACGRVPLLITLQPTSQTNDAGSEVTFSVRAQGLPRPRYQWYFNNGTPITNSGGSGVARLVCVAGCGPAWIEQPPPSDLTLANIQPSQTGPYYVEVYNGLETNRSKVVWLQVNTDPLPLQLDCPAPLACLPEGSASNPPSLTLTPGQTAMFKVMARGYPPPTFQWSWSKDGTNFATIAGATNPKLDIPDAQVTDAGIYKVRVENPGSLTNFLVRLFVKPKAKLKITEAMSAPCFTNANDWWELTNLGNESINLCGYRWDDGFGSIGGGPTVANDVIVRPGESVIFFEGPSTNEFINWWGASNLPTNLQIITHTANGLEPSGDELNIWNPTATDDRDYVDSLSFSTAASGVSFWFRPNDPCSEFGVPSVAGECGAFPSAQGCDVGSPGWTQWTPPQFTSIRHEGNHVRLEWRAQPGSANVVEYTNSLASPPGANGWSGRLGPLSFAGATGATNDTIVDGAGQRFYRIRRDTPTVCDCP